MSEPEQQFRTRVRLQLLRPLQWTERFTILPILSERFDLVQITGSVPV